VARIVWRYHDLGVKDINAAAPKRDVGLIVTVAWIPIVVENSLLRGRDQQHRDGTDEH